jgi:hypothetical protein
MKKPANTFAGLLWIIAAVVLFAEPIDGALRMLGREEGFDWIGLVWNTVDSTIPEAVKLAAFAVLIELVDQIRWQVTQYMNRKSS